jgi:2-polyprenyl-3-methyl-5-hydroxy-6-metoxy-1,4-benzoquinol methylase
MTAGGDRQQVVAAFDRWCAEHPDVHDLLDGESRAYVDYHALRYARLLGAVEEVARRADRQEPLQILDVGPNVQTALLRRAHPGATVDTLGFAHPAAAPREHERHVRMDLNQCLDREAWPALERRYDVIVMAEVVEHLHVPPYAVLSFLAEQLRPPGFVVLQTPNAAALHKRLTLLIGHNPVEAPRISRENPGHFHEYTLAELRQQVGAGGLTVDRLEAENYFGSGAGAEAYRAVGRLLPPTWRHGVTICARSER